MVTSTSTVASSVIATEIWCAPKILDSVRVFVLLVGMEPAVKEVSHHLNICQRCESGKTSFKYGTNSQGGESSFQYGSKTAVVEVRPHLNMELAVKKIRPHSNMEPTVQKGRHHLNI